MKCECDKKQLEALLKGWKYGDKEKLFNQIAGNTETEKNSLKTIIEWKYTVYAMWWTDTILVWNKSGKLSKKIFKIHSLTIHDEYGHELLKEIQTDKEGNIRQDMRYEQEGKELKRIA